MFSSAAIKRSLEMRKNVRRFWLAWVSPRTLEIEDARETLNVQLKEHWKPEPIEVYELIVEDWKKPAANEKDKNYIVFIDLELELDWINNGEMTSDGQKACATANSIDARRCKHLPREQILELKRLVGHAMVNAITGHAEESYKLTAEAAQFLKDRTVERSRSWTLTVAHLLIVVFSGSILIYYVKFHSEQTLIPAFLPLAIEGGAIGAYLSVVQRAGHGEGDAAAGKFLHFIEVFTKLFAGCVLGAISFFISRSVFAPAPVKEFASEINSILVFGIAAGMCERLIPKMISNYSQLTNQQKE